MNLKQDLANIGIFADFEGVRYVYNGKEPVLRCSREDFGNLLNFVNFFCTLPLLCEFWR